MRIRRLNAYARRLRCMLRSGSRGYPRPFSAWTSFLPGVPSFPRQQELGYSARHLLYGKRNGIYRIIFHVQKDEQHVCVLRIWHASRDAITAADVEE